MVQLSGRKYNGFFSSERILKIDQDLTKLSSQEGGAFFGTQCITLYSCLLLVSLVFIFIPLGRNIKIDDFRTDVKK